MAHLGSHIDPQRVLGMVTVLVLATELVPGQNTFPNTCPHTFGKLSVDFLGTGQGNLSKNHQDNLAPEKVLAAAQAEVAVVVWAPDVVKEKERDH